MAVTTRTIIGKVLDAARQPTLDGEYRFTPTQEIRDTTGGIVPKRYTSAPFYATPPTGSDLDPGEFQVDLIANDSDDLAQTASTYRVDLYLASRPGRVQSTFNVVIPKQGSGTGSGGAGPIELGDLVQVTQPGEVFLYLTETTADARYLLKNELPALPTDLVHEADLDAYVKTDDLEPVDLTGYVTTQDLGTAVAATQRTVVYANGSYPPRPTGAAAGTVTYLGPVVPTDWLTGDQWTDNS